MKVDEKERLLRELADLEQRAAALRDRLITSGYEAETPPRPHGNTSGRPVAEPPLCTVTCSQLESDVIGRSRPDGELTYISPGFAHLFRSSVQEILGRTFASFVAESDRESFQKISSLLSAETPERHWNGKVSCDSKSKWIRWSIQGVFDHEDRLCEIQYVGRDITDLQNAQQALALEKAQFERLVQTINSVILESDMQGRILFMNEYGLKLFGFSMEELLGRNVISTIIPEVESTGRVLRELVDAILRDPDGHFDNINENIRKDGTRLWVNWRNTAVKDIHGAITGCLAVGVDITEQRVVQEELRRTELMFRTVGDLIPFGVWMCSPDGTLDYVSDSFLKLTGSATLEDLQPGDRPSLLTFDPSDECLAKWHETSKSGNLWEHEFTVTAADGEIKTILAKGVPIRDNQGEIIVWAGFHLDITAQKQAEAALRQAHNNLEHKVAERTAELQGANQALCAEIDERVRIQDRLTVVLEDLTKSYKDLEQFAYVTSHDLQEPLRNVASCLQLIERRYKEKLGDDADKLIAYAVESIIRMRALILDLLAYSRVSTRGKSPAPTDCGKVIHKALRGLASHLEASNAHVEVDDMPMVMADAGQLALVFQNLIMNGIQFNKADEPHIRISAQRRDSQWMLSVRDNGIGIEPQYLDRIFTIFQRLHTKEEYDGTGMGLAISKKIIERHRGEIWAESRLGEGAVIKFTLPAVEPSPGDDGS